LLNFGLTFESSDASGAERKDEDDTATAILKKKKKPNQLM
jgi:transitional endoplasmic reticulum ATPase